MLNFFYFKSFLKSLDQNYIFYINFCVQGEVFCGEKDGHCEVPSRSHHPARKEADAFQCRLLFFKYFFSSAKKDCHMLVHVPLI